MSNPSQSQAQSSQPNPNSQGMSFSGMQFSPAQMHQLSQMSPQDRQLFQNKLLQRAMLQQQQHQQQQQHALGQAHHPQGMGMSGMSNMASSLGGMDGMGSMSSMSNMGGMGSGMGMGLGSAGVGGMNMGGMNAMSHSAQMTNAQLAQINMQREQQMLNGMGGMTNSHLVDQNHTHGLHQRPGSSASVHGLQQQQHNMHGFSQQQQQMQQHSNMMMPPPSSIPPRPPTATSSRPGTAGPHSHGTPQPPQTPMMTASAASPRPAPGVSSVAMSPRLSSSGGSAGRRTPVTQGPPSQGHQSPRPSSTGPLPQPNPHGPIPIQPRPSSMNLSRNTGSPIPRPGTSQSFHGGLATSGSTGSVGGEVGGGPGSSHTPSRPTTASGFSQGPPQAAPMNASIPTPTSAHPNGSATSPQAPQPTYASSQFQQSTFQQNTSADSGSPSRGVKRKVSETPGTPGPPQTPVSAGSVQPPQTPRMGSIGNINPSMNMNAGGPGGPHALMGGAGGGMMGPPVLPRSQSIGGGPGTPQPSMPSDASAMNGMSPALSRQMSSDMMGIGTPTRPGHGVGSMGGVGVAGPGLTVNTNLAQSAATATGQAGMMSMMPGSATASQVMIPTPTSAVASTMGNGDVHPGTPQQGPVTRQGSQPPVGNRSPFHGANGGQKGPSGPSVLGATPPLTRVPPTEGANGTSTTPTASTTASVTSASQSQTTTVIPHLPPLPAGVTLNPKVSRVSIVPLIDSVKLIPPLSEEEIANVQKWMQADKDYEGMYRKMRERMVDEMKVVVSNTRGWWEKEPLDPMTAMQQHRRRPEKFQLIGMKTGKEDRRSKKAGRREGFKLPRTVDPEEAARPEQLVPIRLEFDVEHHKMRDTFTWNLNDPIITPEIFAQSIVDDYGLASSYHAIITKTIQDQLSDFKAHSTTFGEDGVSNALQDDIVNKGVIDDESEATWWESWRNFVRSDAVAKPPVRPESRSRKRRKVVKDEVVEPPDVKMAPSLADAPMSVDAFEEDESNMHEEMRILIKLDIIVGSVKLEDQLEWDLENSDPTPEQFSEIYCRELGLGGEFKTSIAHSIREQVQIFQKSLFLVGHPSDGSAVQDDDLRMSLLPSLSTGARSMDQVGAFTPLLNYLSESEIERNEKEREKELNRRRRKTTRGRRGIALPDREPPKTFRTPAIGFPEIDPATLALVNAAAAPTSRRAAAAAASLTIANMVASENGTVLIPSTPTPSVSHPVSSVPKEKKPKGLFKAPSYPSTVLRPRAHVKAPTPSTAADISKLPPPLENDLPAPLSTADTKGAKVVLTAKRAKELEREAKEKEYADGQHANYIDGVWHCSNCGCPESIAIGRRKGPLGDKSQCGTCGKFWHRHRRPRPVVYNSDLQFHLNLRHQEEQAKVAASRKKRPHAAQVETSSKAPTVEPETPSKPKMEAWMEVPPMSSSRSAAPEEPDRAVSPVSTASSASEPPLAQKVKANGVNHSAKSAPPASVSEDADDQKTDAPRPPTPPPQRSPAASAPPTNRAPATVPQWLTDAMAEMQTRYPDDRFEVTFRRAATSTQPEWRIKCLDCPGKLYTPGPGETLQNYEVHLKNRKHRQTVNARVNGENL
ncbi:hypothetical protein C8Q75DRAFT_746367 [Abortiporus biennis]|nr:hypothetical protein C8Q75DRAFT_746367 [Abortiporus biennis]